MGLSYLFILWATGSGKIIVGIGDLGSRAFVGL